MTALPERDLLVPRLKMPEWRKHAACLDEDMDSFFPKGRPRSDRKRVCLEQCTVREECLEAALSAPWPPAGIWAGMGPKELEPLWWERQTGGLA